MTDNRSGAVRLALLFMAVVLFCVLTLPAHAADAPTPPAPKTETLKIYPKLLPPQEGEEIIKTGKSFHPEDPIPSDPYERAKDPRTWA